MLSLGKYVRSTQSAILEGENHTSHFIPTGGKEGTRSGGDSVLMLLSLWWFCFTPWNLDPHLQLAIYWASAKARAHVWEKNSPFKTLLFPQREISNWTGLPFPYQTYLELLSSSKSTEPQEWGRVHKEGEVNSGFSLSQLQGNFMVAWEWIILKRSSYISQRNFLIPA